MPRNLDDVIAALPEQRQRRIDALAQTKMRQMLRGARTPGDIRKALGTTQAALAQSLGINQNAVSQLERRSDLHLSTLRKFVECLGMHLELALVTADGRRIDLNAWSTWNRPETAGAPARTQKKPTRTRAPRSRSATNAG